eukprot:5344003-Amphidinium_carterae.1
MLPLTALVLEKWHCYKPGGFYSLGCCCDSRIEKVDTVGVSSTMCAEFLVVPPSWTANSRLCAPFLVR